MTRLVKLIQEIDRFILFIMKPLFSLNCLISFNGGSQYDLRNEKSAYFQSSLTISYMDNWPELGRKGNFLKFELNKVDETPTSVPIVFSGEYTTTIKISGPIPLGNPKS